MSQKVLKRQLHFWDSVAINVGIVIGVGIFRVPSEVAQYLDSGPWILLAWCLGGLLSLCGVLCYAELSSRYPETGGTYVFLREAYGKLVSFVYGWTEFSMLRAGSLAAVSYVLAFYFQNLTGIAAGAEKWIAICAILFFTLLNIAGIRFGTGVQNVLSSLKVLTLLAMSAAIFWLGSNRFSGGEAASSAPSSFLFWPALIPILFSYGGWNESTFMSGEFKETKKALPISLVMSSLMVTGLYLLMNVAYLQAMTPGEMVQSKAIAADIFMKLFGSTGRAIVTLAVLISACGALNSNILTGGRIPFALGLDHARFAWLSHVHDRFETPYSAMLVNSLWAALLVWMGNFEQLLFFYGFAKWIFFTMAGASLFVLRGKSKERSSFEVPGYPFIPFLFILSSAWLCWTVIHHAPREAGVGALLVLTGIPLYYLIRVKEDRSALS